MAEELDIEETVLITAIPQNGMQTDIMFITPHTPKNGRVSLSHY